MFFLFMSDCDYGLIVPADVMDGEVIPYGKKFSECISRATNNIFSLNLTYLLHCKRKPVNRW